MKNKIEKFLTNNRFIIYILPVLVGWFCQILGTMKYGDWILFILTHLMGLYFIIRTDIVKFKTKRGEK